MAQPDPQAQQAPAMQDAAQHASASQPSHLRQQQATAALEDAAEVTEEDAAVSPAAASRVRPHAQLPVAPIGKRSLGNFSCHEDYPLLWVSSDRREGVWLVPQQPQGSARKLKYGFIWRPLSQVPHGEQLVGCCSGCLCSDGTQLASVRDGTGPRCDSRRHRIGEPC